VRWLMVAVLLTAVAFAAGMQIGGSGIDLVGLYTLALFVNVAGVLWAMGVAMRLRTIQAGPVMQMPVFLSLFFAPVYVPLDLLHGWINAVATVNPLTRLLETGRSLIAGTPTEVALAFGVAAGLVALFLLWAFRGLRSAEAAG
jgi:ABC-2 type transport system permease protein